MDTPSTTDTFLNDNREHLNEIVDALIPADSSLEMPSASDAGVLDHYLGTALKLRDDLAPAFISAIERAAMLPSKDIESLLKLGDEDFGIISRVIAGAYFMNRDINAKLRYNGQEEIRETVDYDEIIALIEGPLSRGDVYTHI